MLKTYKSPVLRSYGTVQDIELQTLNVSKQALDTPAGPQRNFMLAEAEQMRRVLKVARQLKDQAKNKVFEDAAAETHLSLRRQAVG